MSNFYTNPAFLDVNVNNVTRNFDPTQPGPSTFSRPSSAGDEYLARNTPEEDDLIKIENRARQDEGQDQDGQVETGEVDNEEPLYVNAKQYHRILKRRAARQRLEELNRLARSRKVGYSRGTRLVWTGSDNSLIYTNRDIVMRVVDREGKEGDS